MIQKEIPHTLKLRIRRGQRFRWDFKCSIVRYVIYSRFVRICNQFPNSDHQQWNYTRIAEWILMHHRSLCANKCIETNENATRLNQLTIFMMVKKSQTILLLNMNRWDGSTLNQGVHLIYYPAMIYYRFDLESILVFHNPSCSSDIQFELIWFWFDPYIFICWNMSWTFVVCN